MGDKCRETSLSEMMNLWVISELYYPEENAIGFFLTGIAEGLAPDFAVHVSVVSQPIGRGERAHPPAKCGMPFAAAKTGGRSDPISNFIFP